MSSVLKRSAAVVTAAATAGVLAVAAPADAHAATEVTTVPLTTGLYQSAYSERGHALWVTSAVGRPPVTTSRLLKVDPGTLEIEATYVPPVTDATTGALEAVYGIDVDDEHGTVWTTNTRNNSVAVYSQRDGSHLASLPNVAHAREVVVDERHDTAWASGYSDGTIVGFDTRTLTEKTRVTVTGSGPAGLAVDERSGTVYAADLANDRIIAVAPGAAEPRFLPAGDGPISVALSKDGRTAYTADQAGGTLSIVDVAAGAVTATVATGAGAISVGTDARTGKVLVANRTAATVSVVDPRSATVTETVAVGANPNHVETRPGTAYVVDKSGAGADGADQLHRIRVGR